MARRGDKQDEIFEFLIAFQEENGYPPSVREICQAVGLRSTATVHYHLEALQKQGRIVMAGMKKRAIKLPNAKPGRIPILGTVTAGQPIPAFEDILGYLPWEGRTNCFALQVRGDSMIHAAILDGDKVVVQPQQTAQNGDIVVAMIDGEATVKRFARLEGHAWLMPENPAYQPILADEASIIGLVRAVYREY